MASHHLVSAYTRLQCSGSYRDITTRKKIGASGFTFGGWVGKAAPIPHTVVMEARGYQTATAPLQLVAGQGGTTALEVKMVRSE